MAYEHLTTQKARDEAELSIPHRRAIIQKERWFSYPRAEEILKKMEWLYEHTRVGRMPNLLIVGESMAGKSSLVKRFSDHLHPTIRDSQAQADSVPVLYLQMASICPTPVEFLQSLLLRINLPFSAAAKADKLTQQLSIVFPKLGTRAIVIDEVQQLMRGSVKAQRALRDQIKLIGNELQLPIICTGIDEARSAFGSDPQLFNRFEIMELMRWRVSDEEDLKYLMGIINKWQNECPLRKPSDMLTPTAMEFLFQKTGGLLGEIIRFLKTASEYALDSGDECINEKTFQKMRWEIPRDSMYSTVV